MERLTIRNSDGSVSQPTSTTVAAVFEKLAAYEDTGLEPEDIGKAMIKFAFSPATDTDERITDVIKAKQEGRLVVLPCRVGDTVYDIYNQDPMKVKQICIGKDRIYIFAIGNNHGGNYAVGEFGNRIFLTRAEAEKAMEVSDDA